MQSFTLLVHVQTPHPTLIQRMLASVLAQSNNSWELVLVTDLANQAEATALAQGQPNVRVALRPDGELLAWSCNALLSTLGDWVGFLGQHDQLTPDALDAMAAVITNNVQARVIYSDEVSLGLWGQVSMAMAKGAPDPIRLASADYLRDLVVIKKSWLQAAGGFDRLASDNPRHDLYLRTLEAFGVTAFAHVTQQIYHRYRNRLSEGGPDLRNQPYLPSYDLDAVRRYYERNNIPVKIKQLNGTLDTELPLGKQPSVTVLLMLGDDLAEGKARLTGIGMLPLYQPWVVQVCFTGQSEYAFDRYTELCKGLRYRLKRLEGNLPAALNQEISATDTDLTMLLQGIPISAHWLQRLVALSQLPGVAAAGGTLITPTRQVDGSPWDTRGELNQRAVPHSVSMLSAACLLVDTRTFLELSGFDPDYPTLFGEDFALRLGVAGRMCASTPKVHVQVGAPTMAVADELNKFRTAWAGWQDPYLLHQLP